MVTPDEEQDQYLKDPRTSCKFGGNCYQKNPLHHQKYKHPPRKRTGEKRQNEQPSQSVKKAKVEPEASTAKISNDISDSEDSGDESNLNTDIITTSNGESSLSENIEKQLSTQSRESSNKDVQRTENLDYKEFIKEKFLVDMPEDFYQFWEFCKSIKASDPENAFVSAGIILVGPYDVLAGKFINAVEKSPEEYLIHWRYFFDTPQFQTVIKGRDATGYHIGYFRDKQNDSPVFLASNEAAKNGEFTCIGGNIFAAVYLYLEEAKKACDPFKKVSIVRLQTSVKKKAEELKCELTAQTPSIKDRNKKILSRTFNKIGLVVPYNKKTQLGYRQLCVTDAQFRKLLDRVANASDEQKPKNLGELQEILTATSIATDECDFGTSIELGWDILAHGVESLNLTIERYLVNGYQLLGQSAFAKIAAAHMKNRKKGNILSIL